MLNRLLLSLFALTLLAPEATAQSALSPSLVAWRTDGGGTTTSTESPYFKLRTPAWWDIDGDSDPELIFWSWFGLERLSRDAESGELALSPVSLSDEAAETFDDARSILALVDTNHDGQDELLVFTDKAVLYRAEGGTVDISTVPLPALSLNCLYDSAVGDLNRDGLADVYLAMGCFHQESYTQSGHPDIVLMNRGGGRFEALELEPERSVLTTSVTLADVDGDGWLDVLESVDASWISGESRLLINRTKPGDTVPNFVPSQHTWDIGTDGMGAALGDLNADGHLDLYNTSIGIDLLMTGDGTGRFVDETLERGIYHLWSSLGRRTQWAPSFVDLNADGHLDLLVRHGVRSILNPRTVANSAADLVYIQEADGQMTRSWTPFVDTSDDGICFAVGDIDDDGLPDAARDAQPGGPILWENATEVPEDTRLLTARLKSSVSASPVTGALLRASCDGETLTRHITSGGKIGASAAYEAHFAFVGCGGNPLTLEVTWPSGAVSTDLVPADALTWVAHEPRWFTLGPTDEVSFDTTNTGAVSACLGTSKGDWSCCEGPCSLMRPSKGPAVVALEGAPAMTLPERESSWLLQTTPHLPTPGEPVTIHLIHVGDEGAFSPEGLELHVDADPVAWESVSADERVMRATVAVDARAAELMIALDSEGVEAASWTRSVGYGLDPKNIHYDLFPVRPLQTPIEPLGWEVYLYAPPDMMDNDVLSHLSVTTEGGTPVESHLEFLFGRRDRLTVSVDWDDLLGESTLLVRDHEGGWTLPLRGSTHGQREPRAEVQSVVCGLNHSRLRVGQDRSFGAVAPLNAEGDIVPLPPSSLTLRVEGGEIVTSLERAGELRDLSFSLIPGDTLGPGRVVVESLEGEALGSCGFEVVSWEDQSDAVNSHFAVLSKESVVLSDPDPTARLRVGMLNEFNEIMGAGAWPTVILSGGTWADPIALTDAGTFSGTIAPNPEVSSVTITLTLAGRVLETLTLAVSGSSPGEGEEGGEGGESSPGGGCSQGTPSSLPALALM